VYWDSFGYVAQAVSGQIGGLGLGRPLFVLISHAVATAIRATGAPVFTVEPVLRLFWLAVSAAAAPLTLTLARECGLSTRASLFAGLAVALSLPLAHVSASVTCVVRLSDLLVPGLPGSKTLRASFTSPLDPYRSR